MQYRDLREDLAAALRWAARERLHEGVDNHFSLAVPDARGQVRGDRFLINPCRMHWSKVKASDVVLCDAEGTVLEGGHAVERSAFCIHSRVHLGHPRAVAALHTHMPYATALAHIQGGRLAMSGLASLMFDGRLAYDDTFDGIALEQEEGERIAAALGHADVLFLGGHGVLVTGRDVAHAFTDLYYLERACMFQVLARSHGGDLLEVSQDVRARTRAQNCEDLPNVARGYFAEIKRVLAEDEPEYLE
jgi:ribulose-5-phosphate 4-epimerase/fuculose-1-phosphate aldolase